MDDCIFCKIIKGEIPAEILRETPNLIAINDVNPQAKIHILVIPKAHIQDVTKTDDLLWVEAKKLGLELMKERGINNFRIVVNAGDAAAVKHLHLHFLGDVDVDRKL